MTIYNIYRALRALKGIYLVHKGLRVRITFGASLEQVKGRYTAWKIIILRKGKTNGDHKSSSL